MKPKRILFLLRQPPYQSSRAIEAIESILVAGVFEQDVSVLFKDDGVWQLIKDQDGAKGDQEGFTCYSTYYDQ